MKGKVPSKLQHSDDLLTSSVIGTFQYLSSPLYFQSVLTLSVNILGEYLSFNGPITHYTFEFWPRLNQSEPDVLVHLTDANCYEYLICIEAKFWSAKSSEEDTDTATEERQTWQRDQLAREIEDLFTPKCLALMNVNKGRLKKTILVYLTNQTYMHFKEIKDSIRYVRGIDFPIDQLYWLSWKEIFNCINKFSNFKTRQDELLLTDLKKLLVRKGLNSFIGFQDCFNEVSPFESRYHTTKILNVTFQFEWNVLKEVGRIQWSYGG